MVMTQLPCPKRRPPVGVHNRRRWLSWAAVSITTVALGLSVVTLSSAQARPWASGDYVVLLEDATVSVVAKAHGVTVQRSTDGAITSLTARLTGSQAAALDGDSRVLAISPNSTFTGEAQTVPTAVRRVGADQPPVSAGTSTSPSAGAIAVLDTGVDTHPDYTRAGGVDCTGINSINDGNGHGTAIAGTAAAISNDRGIVGSSPGARVYSVRVLDSKLSGNLSTLTCGLNWVAANAAALDIRVANLSLGTSGSDDGACGTVNNDALHQAICAIVDAGVVPVAAAGNQGTDYAGQVPAAYDEVLTATNMADYDGRPGGLATTKPCSSVNADDTGAAASNYATSAADAAHTVAAPGECPYTTKKGGAYGYIQSGTSMAAAVTSGVVIDCLQAGQPCAGKSPAQVIQTVVAASRAAGPAHGFTGDPHSQSGAKYRGYLVTTRFSGTSETPPTTTPTTTTPTTTPATSTPPTTAPPPAVDTTAPTVQIVSPASESTVSGTVSLAAAANDDVGVTAVRFYVGTSLLGNATLADGLWVLAYNTASVRNGTYSIVAKAYDAASNVTTSAPVAVVLRN